MFIYIELSFVYIEIIFIYIEKRYLCLHYMQSNKRFLQMYTKQGYIYKEALYIQT